MKADKWLINIQQKLFTKIYFGDHTESRYRQLNDIFLDASILLSSNIFQDPSIRLIELLLRL